jgi:hypothetical protein
MPVHAIHDLLTDPPRPVEQGFELAARRITATWLETRRVIASADDLRLAGQFLQRFGLTIEPLSGGDVRLVSERGTGSVMSREAAILTALRSLVGRGQRPTRAFASTA